MSEITFKLWGMVNKESNESINYGIAKTILSNMNNIDNTSSSAIAKLCNVSKPSISRFVKELGYSDYYDFRVAIRDKIGFVENLNNYDITKNMGIMDEFLDNCKNNIDKLRENVNEIELGELAQLILKYEKIYIFGNMQSGSIAQILQYGLYCQQKMVVAVMDIMEQEEIIKNLNGDELLIIFSATGKSIPELFKADIPSKTMVYLITTNPEIENIPKVHVINAKTGQDLSASNMSLRYIAEVIHLKYRYFINAK